MTSPAVLSIIVAINAITTSDDLGEINTALNNRRSTVYTAEREARREGVTMKMAVDFAVGTRVRTKNTSSRSLEGKVGTVTRLELPKPGNDWGQVIVKTDRKLKSPSYLLTSDGFILRDSQVERLDNPSPAP